MDINALSRHLPVSLTETILLMGTDDIEEIRIISEKNASVIKSGFLLDTGVKICREEMKRIVDSMCRGSMYAMQTSLTRGFITLGGGHRVGICGRTVTQNGIITHMTDISALCIRVSREIIGAADGIMEYLECNGRIYNTLIISPPGGGKTTLLRDIARQMGARHKVCIADERSEIAASKDGVPTHDVGRFTSVMDSVPKAEGIRMLLRTMSPEIIITDETGDEEEEKAISHLINCGVKIITSAHGYSEKDLVGREFFGRLISRGVFERIFVLGRRDKKITVEKIITDGRRMLTCLN